MSQRSAPDRTVWVVIAIVTGIALLFIPFSRFVLNVNYDYTLSTVAVGGALLGIVAGVLGCFAVLRRESLMGDALSHAALPGVGVAFLIAGRDLGVLLLGAGIASWLGVLVIQAITRTTRIKQDAAMGIVLATWFAAGIALLAFIQSVPDARQAGLKKFIFGQAAAMVQSDVQLVAIVAIVMGIVLTLLWKEFKLITFDLEFATANGFRTGLLNALLSTMIVIAIVLGLQLAGVILMVGLLIAPGIAARQWTHRLDQMVILAAVFGAFSGAVGGIISGVDNTIPTGPMIIIIAFTLVMLSLAIAPQRGLLWVVLRTRSDRRRFAAQTTLRDMYRYALSHQNARHPIPVAFIRGITGSQGVTGLKQLEAQGLAARENDAYRLTPAGVQAAASDEANQRLWDVYREYSHALDLPQVNEDRQKDIRDVLPAGAVDRLQQTLEGTHA
jgi:manganese/zinc/iron transport system permease protein